MGFKQILILVVLLTGVCADVYFHVPRGSNDRLNSRGRNRRNARRLFDSQNNARGGYNVGEEGLEYIVGSTLSIQWTNQHSCSGPNNNCEIVLQYMCSDKLRDGTSEGRIRLSSNADGNTRFGMQEDLENYLDCNMRQRNQGLFLADQKLKGKTAIYTRQDSKGTRYGFECPEERDYYPYWGPSPWKDIAVLTSDTDRCNVYKTESANVKDRYYCKIDFGSTQNKHRNRNRFRNNPLPITKEECESFSVRISGQRTPVTGTWTKIDAHGIQAPECVQAPQSRDNHNGNGLGGFPNMYNWTIPNDVNENCALRIRYNISTGDFPRDTFSDSELDIGKQADILDKDEAKERNYELTGNPVVKPLKVNGEIRNFELKLAINTDQYGRTFQDRSHQFSIIKRPDNIPQSASITNLNVQGKRGNIVQVYPAVEYDFVPNRLEIAQGDYVHIQWTGANTNPRNNAGQGRAGTDKSNMALLRNAQYKAAEEALADKPNKFGHWANSYPAHLSNTSLLGFSLADRVDLAFSGNNVQGNDELDKSKAYFNLGPKVVNQIGTHRYFCTRNNNFSNRGQKGVIVVRPNDTKKDEQEESSSSLLDEIRNIEKLEAEIKNLVAIQK